MRDKGADPTSTGEPMRNLTLAVHDSTYLDARIWAAHRDTTITSVVRYLLENLQSNQTASSAFPTPTPRASNRRPRSLQVKFASD